MKEVNIISKIIGRALTTDSGVGKGSSLPSGLSQYLMKEIWDKVFEIRQDNSGNEFIYGKLPVVTKYGVTMHGNVGDVDLPTLYAGLPIDGTTIYWDNGVLKALGGGGEADSILWGNIKDKPSWLTDTKPTYNYTEIDGRPDLSEFATLDDLAEVEDKLYDFLEGSDTDTIINKWLELEDFLEGLSESDNLAYILSNKASMSDIDAVNKVLTTKWTQDNAKIANWDKAYSWGNHADAGYVKKEYVDNNFVTLATDQTIAGLKDFTKGIKLNGIPLYKSTDDVVYLDGNLVVRGGVVMHGSDGTSVPGLLDSLPIASTSSKGIAQFNSSHFSVSDGVVSLVSGAGGGGLDQAALKDYLELYGAPKLSTARKLWGQSFDGSGDVSGDISNVGQIFRSRSNAVNADGYGNLYFNANDLSPQWSVKNVSESVLFTVKESGNVGIGTISPAYKLDVNGTSCFRGDYQKMVTVGNGIGIHSRKDSSTESSAQGVVTIGYSGTSLGSMVGSMITGDTLSYFYYGKNWNNSPLNIYPSGNVSVGGLSDTNTLSVLGTLSVSGATTINSLLTVNSVIRSSSTIYSYYTGNGLYLAGNSLCYHEGSTWVGNILTIDRTNKEVSIPNKAKITGLLTASGGIDCYANSWFYHLYPQETNKYNLGNSSSRWAALYVGSADLTGSITVKGSVIATDIHGNGSALYLGNSSNASYVYLREDMAGVGNNWSISVGGSASFVNLSVGNLATLKALSITGNESNNIASVYNDNSAITTNSPVSLASIRHGLSFKWYDTDWQIGNIRSGSTATSGFGITSGNSTLCFRVQVGQSTCYGNFLVSGGVTMHSQRSLKNIISEQGLSLRDLEFIKPTRYTWKDGRDNRLHIGGIADDIQRVLPEVVYKTDDGTLSMDYGNAAFAIAASLIKPVVDHERRIALLEKENEELRKEIERLKIA